MKFNLAKKLRIWNEGILITDENFLTTRVRITADNVYLWKSDIDVSDINVTVDITASGANGLDTGAESSATWYYIYGIYNPDTYTFAGTLSTSSSQPTFPSGYTDSILLGTIYNDSSADFLRVYKVNDYVFLPYRSGGAAQANRVLSEGRSTTMTIINLSSIVSPEADRAVFHSNLSLVHNAESTGFTLFAKPTGFVPGDSQPGYIAIQLPVTSTVTPLAAVGEFTMPVDRSTYSGSFVSIEYRIDNVPSSTGGAYIDVAGYYEPIR